ENFYHIYRIDHVIGCFRIWAMEHGQKPTEGQFIPADSGLVLMQGTKVLNSMIQASNMLPIAEDLGIMPDGASQVLIDLGIPGTRVVSHFRQNKGQGPYVPLCEYDPVNLTCFSTHDLETAQGWWQTYPTLVQDFYQMLGSTPPEFTKDTQIQLLKLSHHTSTLFHVNLLNEYLACIPGLTSDKPDDERINRPGIVSPDNWTYRYKLSVEQLLSCQALISTISSIITC
ncbi:MAG TPA: 4-alpha-glucanotransferase, partial [Chlamydiales bacterium]|nr:4-alpha-glucanotransferase [Chlamydiales bacterium]